ncbi:hypothetical protein ACMA1D_16380 [Streptomyces sp. 796.1]|uniref:hypothetical protein n=1 Tax=Streptomyces sp. 796.1 TaxID=3163029 RepID=UPI0039C94A4A
MSRSDFYIVGGLFLLLHVALLASHFVLSRKRITYHVQVDTPICVGLQATDAVADWELGGGQGHVQGTSLVRLRIKNDGNKNITRHDLQEPLSVEFPDRLIVAVQAVHVGAGLCTPWTRNRAFTVWSSKFTLPTFPLKRRGHFTLLFLLAGDGNTVVVNGYIAGGSIRRKVLKDRGTASGFAWGRVHDWGPIASVGLLGGFLAGAFWKGTWGPLPEVAADASALRSATCLIIVCVVWAWLWITRDTATAQHRASHLAAAASVCYLLTVVLGVPAFDEVASASFNPSETAQLLTSVGALASAIGFSIASIIRAVAQLKHSQADLERARRGQSASPADAAPSEPAAEPDPNTPSP